ncbi:MAG: bacteriorhodopsin [Bacteroidetes bacterium]|nr:bacteriorhodopsin [Bacteroidota bacterium]MDA0888241.1 bacteriorhodopsin [Bacteroidota bacterium]MDA1084363.1 bacteriorhodopsin [Bacteroidota bacterium]CAI8295991.1 MAG: Green-light absorbing proteorhodopsin [Bacteroidota bacterium]
MTLTNLVTIADLSDPVNFTFFLGTMAMTAASAFFFLSLNQFDSKWRTSILVSGLITFIAAVHYYYMREAATTGGVTTEIRYIDWILTVPLMCVEFYLILKAAGATKKHLSTLIWASLVMLVTGYFGEVSDTASGPALWGLASGLAYFYIAWLIKFGPLAKLAAAAGGSVEKAHKTLTLFVLIGWAIYPLGYMIGTDGWYDFVDGIGLNMDVVYNIGDAINKIGFGLVVYAAAVSSK